MTVNAQVLVDHLQKSQPRHTAHGNVLAWWSPRQQKIEMGSKISISIYFLKKSLDLQVIHF